MPDILHVPNVEWVRYDNMNVMNILHDINSSEICNFDVENPGKLKALNPPTSFIHYGGGSIQNLAKLLCSINARSCVPLSKLCTFLKIL